MITPWKFNKQVAQNFKSYADKHIPDYKSVINLTLDIANIHLNKDSSIVDVGCATGVTLDTFKEAGFTNLIGIDSSIDMLNECNKCHTLIQSDVWPNLNAMDMIIANWTLHFIPKERRRTYIVKMLSSLSPNGICIITEKTLTSDITKELYYNYKRRQGVSDEEILEKEAQLEGVLEVCSIDWYLCMIKSMGYTVDIINGKYGFITFLIKNRNE